MTSGASEQPAQPGELASTSHSAEGADRLRRRVLWSMPTGLYVVGSRDGARANLMTCNLIMQVSTTPRLVAMAIESNALTRSLIVASGVFSVCILDRRDRALVRRFVKPVDDQRVDAAGTLVALGGEPVHEVVGGVPVLDASLAWLACRLRQDLEPGGDAGPSSSHRLLIGEVVDAGEAEGREPAAGQEPVVREVLRMEDTRMNYGG